MGSRFGDWVYWRFFPITINYYSSQSILTTEATLHSSRYKNLSTSLLQSQSQIYVATDGQSASLSWNKAPIWDLRPDLY
jgi:hypothetical protein